MKSLLLITSFLFSFICFGQKNITNNEVVIIYFENQEEFTSKYKTSDSKKDNRKDSYIYSFLFNKVDRIELNYREYDDFDEMEKNNPVLFFEVNKSFLRKNKNMIFTYEKMLELGYSYIFNLLNKAKHILLIDKEDKYKNKITIKRVFHHYIASE